MCRLTRVEVTKLIPPGVRSIFRPVAVDRIGGIGRDVIVSKDGEEDEEENLKGRSHRPEGQPVDTHGAATEKI